MYFPRLPICCLAAAAALATAAALPASAAPNPNPQADAQPVTIETPTLKPVEPPPPNPPAQPPQPLDPNAVLARVNSTEIKGAEVQHVIDVFLLQAGPAATPERLASIIRPLRARVLEELIMRQIMFDQAKTEHVTLSDQEYREIRQELAASLPQGVTIEDMLKQTGSSEDELRGQMLIRKLLMTHAEQADKASEKDARAFYDEYPAMFQEPETITASHILLKTNPDATKEENAAKRQKIEELRKQLLDGADFAALARENSDCPSAANGGELAPFSRGVMVKAFEDAAFTQDLNTIGNVVETPFGYHIIKVTEKHPARTLPFDEVKDRITERLTAEKQAELVKAYIEKVSAAATVTRMDSFTDATPAPSPPHTESIDTPPPPEAVEPAEAAEAPAAEPAAAAEAPAAAESPAAEPAAEPAAPAAAEAPATAPAE